MKLRFLLVSIAALAGIATWFACSNTSTVISSAYNPRSETQVAGDAFGMEPYWKKLKGNIATGEIDPMDWINMNAAVQKHLANNVSEKSAPITWWEMGPDNIGGRTRAILALDDNQTVYAGSVTGGLWKSTNGANTWDQVDSFPVCAVGSIARTGNGTIYVGTGCQFETGGGTGGSGSIGNGLYFSADNGATWDIVPGTETTPFNLGQSWTSINDLEGDPNDDDRVWIAGSAGIGYWDAGSQTLDMDMDGIPNQDGHDIAVALDGSYILAGSASCKVFRSTDGGQNFTELEDGLPNSSDRIRLEISPDNSNVCYALYSDGYMDGVFYSGNQGDSWSTIWPDGNFFESNPFGDNGQGTYDLALIVKHGDPTKAFVGGVTLWQCGSGFQPEQIAYNNAFGGFENYVHSDIHTFEQSPDGTLYVGCDGGVFKSTDGGETYIAANRNYNVTQYYGMAHSGGFPVMGGAQDNGTTVILGMNNGIFSVVSDQQAIELQGGDGFDCDMSNVTEGFNTVLFSCSQNGGLRRSDATGNSGAFWDNDILNILDPDTQEGGPFYTAFRMYENTEDEDSEQYVILINEEDHDVTDTTYTLFTQNLTLPFEYTLEDGDVLHYWEELIRPELVTTELLTEDPNYFWLEPQDLDFEVEICDSAVIGTEFVIEEITFLTDTVFWTDTLYYEQDTIIVNDFTVVILDSDTTFIEEDIWEITGCNTEYHYAADTLYEVHEQRLVQDQYTSMFVTGFFGSEGIWMTRQALNMSVTPDWWKIGNAPGGGVKAYEFNREGHVMFYCSWEGGLWRVQDIDKLWSVDDVGLIDIDQLESQAGGTVTSMASDPNNPNHLVITLGGYGGVAGGKVRETFNALAEDPADVDWDDIWQWTGSDAYLENMPIYASVIDGTDDDGSTIVVGSEFGSWISYDHGDNWELSIEATPGSTGRMGCVPVHDLRQQQVYSMRYMTPSNHGSIYAGTHGRGIFRNDTFLDVAVQDTDVPEIESQLLIYPNPTSGEAYLNLELNAAADVVINIYNANGQLVNQLEPGMMMRGNHRIALGAERFAKGNYIVHVNAGSASGVAKFIKSE